MPKKTQNKKKIVQSKPTAKGKPAAKKRPALAKKPVTKKSSALQSSASKKTQGAGKSKSKSTPPKAVAKQASKKSPTVSSKPVKVKKPVKTAAKPVAKSAARSDAKPTVKSQIKPAKKVAVKQAPVKATVDKPIKTIQSKSLSGRTIDERPPLEPRPQTISNEDLARFKAILLQKRRRLHGDVAMMSEEALGSEEGAIDNHAPIHPAEVGSHSFEQEFTLDLLSHDGDRIHMIEMALEKLEEGTYGQCDECGARILKGRLEMLPESIYCVKCATKMEGN
jgi:RNA polymerase-binding transcription factor DksA